MKHLSPVWKAIANSLKKGVEKGTKECSRLKAWKCVSGYTLHLIVPMRHNRACRGLWQFDLSQLALSQIHGSDVITYYR